MQDLGDKIEHPQLQSMGPTDLGETLRQQAVSVWRSDLEGFLDRQSP